MIAIWANFDWDAVRDYASLVVLTIVALYATWKDSKDYRERAEEESGSRISRWLKRKAIPVLYIITLASFVLGYFDVHSKRKEAREQEAKAEIQNAANQKEIESLRTGVKTGNDLIGQQRQDFLKQFGDMSSRLADLQTQIKTSDLQSEASQLKADLEANRKAMEPSRATLSFDFWSDADTLSRTITLNVVDGAVKIPFTVANETDSDALEGSFSVRVCDGCKIVGMPEGFTQLNGQDEHERYQDFQHVLANTHLPKMNISVIPPAGADGFQIGLLYNCRTCSHVKSFPPSSIGTVTLGPGWKPRKFQPRANLVSPKP